MELRIRASWLGNARMSGTPYAVMAHRVFCCVAPVNRSAISYRQIEAFRSALLFQFQFFMLTSSRRCASGTRVKSASVVHPSMILVHVCVRLLTLYVTVGREAGTQFWYHWSTWSAVHVAACVCQYCKLRVGSIFSCAPGTILEQINNRRDALSCGHRTC